MSVKGKRISLMWLFVAAIVLALGLSVGFYVWNNFIAGHIPATGFETGAETPFGEVREPTPEDKYFYQTGGTLKLDFSVYWSYDDSAITSNHPQIKVFHADKETLFASDTDGSINYVSSDLWISDQGILYLVVDWGTGTSYYLDVDKTVDSNAYIVDSFAWDADDDGTLEYAFTIDVTSLPTLAAGETQKTIAINLYVWKAESAPSLTSSLNVTGVSTSSYNYYTCEGYISGWDGEGYAIKIVKVQLTLPNANNASYVEDGYVKLMYVSLGYGKDKSWKWTSYTWEYANKRWTIDIGVTDPTEEYYGKLIKYERGAGSTFAEFKVQIYAKFPSTGKKFMPTLKIYYIKPDGTTASITQVLSFSS